MGAEMRDRWQLLCALYRAAYRQLTKSPSNLWISALVQVFYYLAQFGFWLGVRQTNAGQQFLSDAGLYGFLVTLGVVDNIYLLLFGSGSAMAEQRIATQTLEPLLTRPRSALRMLVWGYPNWSHLPATLVSIVFLVWYYLANDIATATIMIHLIAIALGIAIMNGISFLYRLSTFWTRAITQIRHSNPSYKIIIRPYAAFHGPIKFTLLTIFPALLITALPAELLTNGLPPAWLLYCAFMTVMVWAAVRWMWQQGLRRYGVKVN